MREVRKTQIRLKLQDAGAMLSALPATEIPKTAQAAYAEISGAYARALRANSKGAPVMAYHITLDVSAGSLAALITALSRRLGVLRRVETQLSVAVEAVTAVAGGLKQ